MPVDLGELAAPGHTAVVTSELQRGVVGDLAVMAELAAEVTRAAVLSATSRLLAGARRAGATIVHCTVEYRPDRAGSPSNSPLLAALSRGPVRLVEGSPEAEVVPDLGPDPSDLVERRRHGLSPFGGTSLDQTLRNVGVSTVVATGVSLNVGVFGLCVEAVNLGYRVVVPRDAVVGVPAAYGDAVLANSIAFLATLTTVDELLSVWAAVA